MLVRKFIPMELGWAKVPNCECLFVHRQQGLFLSFYVDAIKMTGKKQNIAPMWKKWMKNVGLDEPTSFPDHENLGCTRRECKPNEIIIDEYRNMFQSPTSAGAAEKLPGWEKTRTKNSRVVIRYGGTRGKMRRTVLRIGEQKDRAVVQSLKSLLGRPSFQERGT